MSKTCSFLMDCGFKLSFNAKNEKWQPNVSAVFFGESRVGVEIPPQTVNLSGFIDDT